MIELLVVVTIIGILAALIASATRSAILKSRINLAQAELAQMESAIKEYKTELGSYPPDNPGNPALNPLYFELLGTTNDGNTYVTLDGSGQISNSSGDINSVFQRQGFANSSTHAHSGDEHGAPMSFLTSLRPKQIGQLDTNRPLIKILVCSIEWPPEALSSAPISNTTLNPWRYISSNPINNPGSYDLWVNFVFGNKTYRISNWSDKPEILP